MRIRHYLLTSVLLSLMLMGCKSTKMEETPQTEPAPEQTTATEPLFDEEGLDPNELSDEIVDDDPEPDPPPIYLLSGEDAIWTAAALETIQMKTARLFLPRPDIKTGVTLHYKDLKVYGNNQTRVLCGYLHPVNSRMDKGKHFPFIFDKEEVLSVSATAKNSPVFERKWQTYCQQHDGRAVPLKANGTGILFM